LNFKNKPIRKVVFLPFDDIGSDVGFGQTQGASDDENVDT